MRRRRARQPRSANATSDPLDGNQMLAPGFGHIGRRKEEGSE